MPLRAHDRHDARVQVVPAEQVGLELLAQYVTAKVLNGARPGNLPQLYEEAPSIAINLKTAEVIGLYLYADVLAAADEIYRDIRVR